MTWTGVAPALHSLKGWVLRLLEDHAMMTLEGFAPPTKTLGPSCSNLLSYRAVCNASPIRFYPGRRQYPFLETCVASLNDTSGRTCTYNLSVRSRMPYLFGHGGKKMILEGVAPPASSFVATRSIC